MLTSLRTAADADERLLPGNHRWHASPDESAGGSARPAGNYPVPVLAAAILTVEGVSFLLVGSAALWLHGEPVTVADADLVIEPGEQNLRRLREALAQLALRPREIPRVQDFPLLHLVSVTTSYGRIDSLLERGRHDWERLRQFSVTIPVADAGVLVAARADAWALRRQFKE
jgi:hypothetical protein